MLAKKILGVSGTLSLIVLKVIKVLFVQCCPFHSFINTIRLPTLKYYFGIVILCLAMQIFVSLLAKSHQSIVLRLANFCITQ